MVRPASRSDAAGARQCDACCVASPLLQATYLDDFLDKIRGLPQQVQRNFDLIRSLDEVRQP